MLSSAPTAGFSFPRLVLCPQQNPGLANLLAADAADHAFHVHHSDGDTNAPVTLTDTDPGCALWTGSNTLAATLPWHTTLTRPDAIPAPPVPRPLHVATAPARPPARAPPVPV